MSVTAYDSWIASGVDGTRGDMTAATWRVHLIDASEVMTAADSTVADLVGVLGEASFTVALVDASFTADSFDVSGVSAGVTIGAVVVSVGDGSDADVLVAWIDTGANLMPLALLTTGDPITVSWPRGVYRFG